MENAAVYARYSSANQNDASIEQQVDAAREFARANGYQVVAVYADRAISGTTDRRPQFQQMLSDSAQGKWSVLICWKTDRFARNRYDSAVSKYALKRNGVRVVYVKESIPEGPTGILMESLLEAQAEYYSANLAQNVRRGMAANAQELKANTFAPYGLLIGPDGRFMVDDVKAPIAREIFSRYARGDGPASIARWLNDEGIPSPFNTTWAIPSVANMIRNESYIGTYHYDGHVVPHAFPAIVDEATFAACQRRLSQSSKHTPRVRSGYRYILTGKTYCGLCGHRISGRSATCRRNDKVYCYHRYACRSTEAGRSCGLKSVRAEDMEQTVLTATKRCVLSENAVKVLVPAIMQSLHSDDENTVLGGLRSQLAEKTAALGNIVKAVEQGIISTTLQARLAELEQDVADLQGRIREEESRNPAIDPDLISFWLMQFMDEKSDLAVDDRIVNEFIDRITIWPDRITIRYKLGISDSETVILRDSSPGQIVSKYDNATVWLIGCSLLLELVRTQK